MRVLCIDDSNLPEGANVVEGREYAVIASYANKLDQNVYIIGGAVNEGRTKLGMIWKGYRAERFIQLQREVMSKVESKKEEV